MSLNPWMIYGATGTTGTLVAEEAIRRGHRPLLAGRSAEALAALGKRLDLPWMAVRLDESGQLQQAVSEVDAVLNAAGPFIATAPPLVQACLAARTHYMDIAGEIPVPNIEGKIRGLGMIPSILQVNYHPLSVRGK